MANKKWGDNCFHCEECGEIFRSPLFCITRAVERMHCYEEPRLSEVEIIQAEEIATYCSAKCAMTNRDRVLERDGVKVTYPGSGPIECCSKCSKPVDMTSFHKAWTEEEDVCIWDGGLSSIQPFNVLLLAVACRDCEPSSDLTVAIKERVGVEAM